MLTDTSTTVVRATLPAVGAALPRISERFYARMFADHPELLRDLFNRANQASGAQQQALAGAIAAFAGALLNQPGRRPDALLGRIAHKHASLGISPGQYGLVHTHLLAAIAEVLGDAVTEEVAGAWSEVYWLMANSLIAIERRLYAEHGVLMGDTWRPWTVTGRIRETPDVVTFVLNPADNAPAPAFRAGQYVSVRVELPDGSRQIRQYSLSRATTGATSRFITVKRVDGEVSAQLHDRTERGAVIEVSAPYGDVVVEDTSVPLLLASAGIGCTPMVAMLEELGAARHTGPVTVLHGDRSPGTHALRADHRALAGKLPGARVHFRYGTGPVDHPADTLGRADLTGVPLDPGLTAYLCGPLPFMRAIRTQLLARGIPAARIHYESFGPDLWHGRD
ncbi:globin domain-containing protein [Streptomyces paludis]|uniref:nitric oxide dioxygenase n=1 Tax=Streptomyces paludis TaxID=2282738 RepID=A0A345HME2_9ACTN|nr:globin domain-containing protein [Streptomyces paludis]AXG77866.1 hemin transporter [Streptomyces paludis]